MNKEYYYKKTNNITKDYEKLINEWGSFINEINDIEHSNEEMPHDMDSLIMESVHAKRMGSYYRAFTLQRNVMLLYNVAYSEMLLIMYKNFLSAGCLYEAYVLLSISLKTSGMSNVTFYGNIPTNQSIHMEQFTTSLVDFLNTNKSSTKFVEYIKSISGNPNYKLDIRDDDLDIEIEKTVAAMRKDGRLYN